MWLHIKEYGCQDPFWPDGSNMNLERNHIAYHKKMIGEICAELEIPLPEEFYIPEPPEVNERYMACLRNKNIDDMQLARVERLRQFGKILTSSVPDYDPYELTLI